VVLRAARTSTTCPRAPASAPGTTRARGQRQVRFSRTASRRTARALWQRQVHTSGPFRARGRRRRARLTRAERQRRGAKRVDDSSMSRRPVAGSRLPRARWSRSAQAVRRAGPTPGPGVREHPASYPSQEGRRRPEGEASRPMSSAPEPSRFGRTHHATRHCPARRSAGPACASTDPGMTARQRRRREPGAALWKGAARRYIQPAGRIIRICRQ
jgi:hypothetical protein